MSTINERIKEIRLGFDLTQEEFGQKIGLSKSGISNIEKSIRGVSSRLQKLICITFDINEKWLKLGEGKKNIFEVAKSIESLIIYLKSIGYLVETNKSGESESGCWEENKDNNNQIVGRSWIPDEEYFEITLFKDGKSTTFTDNEFENIQKAINETIEYQIWLKNK